jgi:hypothetical protein
MIRKILKLRKGWYKCVHEYIQFLAANCEQNVGGIAIIHLLTSHTNLFYCWFHFTI